jgi:hypothetical protein
MLTPLSLFFFVPPIRFRSAAINPKTSRSPVKLTTVCALKFGDLFLLLVFPMFSRFRWSYIIRSYSRPLGMGLNQFQTEMLEVISVFCFYWYATLL